MYADIEVTKVFDCQQTPGRLKLTDQHLIFKNQKTGKIEQIPPSEMEMVNYQKFPGTWGLRLWLKNGTLRRFRGFKESVRLIFILFKIGILLL